VVYGIQSVWLRSWQDGFSFFNNYDLMLNIGLGQSTRLKMGWIGTQILIIGYCWNIWHGKLIRCGSWCFQSSFFSFCNDAFWLAHHFYYWNNNNNNNIFYLKKKNFKPKLWRLLKIEISIGGWSALYPIVAPLEVQAKGEKHLGKAKGIKV
jgi:hypothetical protein